jgi:hypothetical protein
LESSTTERLTGRVTGVYGTHILLESRDRRFYARRTELDFNDPVPGVAGFVPASCAAHASVLAVCVGSTKGVKMGPRIKDLSGLVSGRLTVLSFAYVNRRRQAVWWCLCQCGRIANVIGTNLTTRRPTVSCGCYKRDWYWTRPVSVSQPSLKPGMPSPAGQS